MPSRDRGRHRAPQGTRARRRHPAHLKVSTSHACPPPAPIQRVALGAAGAASLVLLSACAAPAISSLATLTDTAPVAANTVATATLLPPTNLSVTRPAASNVLGWTATSSPFATGYNIYADTESGGPYAKIGTVTGRTTTTWTDPEPTRHRDTTYVVTAISYEWYSGNSNESVGAFQSYDKTVLADVPTAYWRLGSTPGTTTLPDSSGNGRNATLVPGTVLGQPSLLGTSTDTSMTASPSGDSGATTPFNAAFNSATISVEMWVKTPATMGGQTYARLIGKDKYDGTTDGRDYNLYAYSTDGVRVTGLHASSGPLGHTIMPLATALAPNSTHHIVVTLEKNVHHYYLDGVEQTQPLTYNTPGSGAAMSTAPLSLGGDPTIPWKGGLDEVAVYTKVLTPAQVRAHFRAGDTPALAVNNSYAQMVGTDAPLGFWRMDDPVGSATMKDATGNRRDATITGGQIALGQPSRVSTTSNPSVAYAGSTDTYAAVPYDAAMNSSTISIESWIRTPTVFGNNVSGFRYLFYKQGNSGPLYRDYEMYATSADGVRVTGFHLSSDVLGQTVLTLTTPLDPNTTHHVVVTANGNDHHYYVDGVEQTNITSRTLPTSGATMSATPFQMNRGDASGPWNGGTDEVALYNKVLTPAQVAAHYNAGAQVPQNVITGTTGSDATVRWDPPPADDAFSGYKVYRGTTPTNLIEVATVAGPARAYSDAGLPTGDYYYAVAGITPDGLGPRSAPVLARMALHNAKTGSWNTPGVLYGGLDYAGAVNGSVLVNGWASDGDAPSATSVVEVFATPANGGPTVFLGRIQTSAYRPDLAAIDPQLASKGYSEFVPSPGPGTWTIFAYIADTNPTPTNYRAMYPATFQVTF